MAEGDVKSYVTLETHVCAVCGKEYDTGALLLDKRLREKFEHRTATGWGLCDEHKKLADDGYVAIIEVTNGPCAIGDANRTGNIAHVRRSAWSKIFRDEPPEGPIALMSTESFSTLQALSKKSAG